EIADRIWLVGHHLKGDQFQCHVYLIENGEQSVLFDPGSELTFAHTLKKIEEVTAFSNIRYFVCHHQDPDITACLPRIDALISRDDAVLVTHWRAAALLKHYGLKHLPFWQIEDHDWQLDIGGRQLDFILTPYMHFPGAFCSFDRQAGVLFSSDIFGGFTEHWSLFARDEGYFEAMRPFHEHYIPSREIMRHGMMALEQFPIRMIAPQHGSIIPASLTRYMIDKLKTLECGLFLMTTKDSDTRRLIHLNRMIREISGSLLQYRDFQQVADHVIEAVRTLLPLKILAFYIVREDGEVICLSGKNRYHGEVVTLPDAVALTLDTDLQGRASFKVVEQQGRTVLLVPLGTPHSAGYSAIAELKFVGHIAFTDSLGEVIEQLSEPMAAAIEREMMLRSLEAARSSMYARYIRDPLTGLYTRGYMQDGAGRMISNHARNAQAGFALIMTDIDHFKAVNDNHGHQTGDAVLAAFAGVMLNDLREVDIPVRYGGEEFALFVPCATVNEAQAVAERIRIRVAETPMTDEDKSFYVTLSAGVAQHESGEELAALIKRADAALYEAKNSGRNRTCIAAA
ncbi:MAG: diguanylate cyclase, partial [Mariprofundaceae bacterium]|nr:diguanylate cyclase [Mariprofundaceae bacterium]